MWQKTNSVPGESKTTKPFLSNNHKDCKDDNHKDQKAPFPNFAQL